MAISERIQVSLELVTSKWKGPARDAASDLDRVGDSAANSQSKIAGVGNKLAMLGKGAAIAGLAAAGAAVGKFVAGSIEAAKDLGESVNAVNQVFGEAAGTVLEFGEVAAQVAGLSAREFNQLATNTGALLSNFGFSAQQAASESVRLSVRAADMASVFNTDVSEALNAVNAALRGETEPIRRFGVSLNDAAIRSRAVSLGLATATKDVDEHGKAVAALDLIYEQTAKVQGDFIRTSDELANAERRAAAEMENAQARLGKALIPVKTSFSNLGADILGGLQVLGLFGGEARQAAKQSVVMEQAVGVLNAAIRDGKDVQEALATALAGTAEAGDLTVGAVEALAGATGLAADEVLDAAANALEYARANDISAEEVGALEDAMVNQIAAMQTSVDEKARLIEAHGLEDAAARAAAAGVDVYGAAAGNAARETISLRDATLDLHSRMLEAANPIFGAVGAIDRMRDAQARLDEVLGDSKSTSQDVAAAQLEVARTTLEAQAAIDQVDPTTMEEGFRAIEDALGDSGVKASDLLTTLGLLDGKKVTSIIETKVVTTGDSTYVARPGGGVSRALERAGSQRQHGGQMLADRPYIVGERRPEVVVPTRNSMVFPSVGDFLAAQGRTYSPTINITAPDGMDAARKVRAALAFDAAAAQ